MVRGFEWDRYRLSYEVHGQGPRVLVYMNGLLFDAGINRILAEDLAARGNRVILLDLLGHGRSDKPRHAAAYRMDLYARQVLALLDHLGVEKAVLGGPSLAANVSLIVAATAPERVKGLVVEMPVLEWAVPSTAAAFVPFLLLLRYARPVARFATSMVRRLPRTGFGPLDSLMNAMSLGPEEMGAIIHGVLMGPVAPTYDERIGIGVPALVVGHGLDLIHPFSDAANLADQLPNARLLKARSILELRVMPKRLSGEIADFLDAVWGGAARIWDSEAG